MLQGNLSQSWFQSNIHPNIAFVHAYFFYKSWIYCIKNTIDLEFERNLQNEIQLGNGIHEERLKQKMPQCPPQPT